MDIVTIYEGEDKCSKCEGWKRVDSVSGDTWKHWAELPVTSQIAVQVGLIKPVECPRCHGTGVEPCCGDDCKCGEGA